MKKIGIITVFIFLNSFFCLSILSQNPFLKQYNNTDNGLISNICYRVFQDSEGFIWICTNNGLSKFNGHQFINYTIENGLPFNDILNLFEDNNKRLWLCNYSSVFCYLDLITDKIVTIENKSSLQNNYISSFSQLNDSILVTNLFYDDFYFVINTKQSEVKKVNLKSNGNYCDHESSLKNIEQFRIKNNNFKIIDGIHLFTNFDIAIYDKNTLLGTKNDSLYIFTKSNIYKTKINAILKNEKQIVNIRLINENKFLLLTNKKAIVIDTLFNILPEFHFLKQFNINNIFIDNEENYWMINNRNGVYFITKNGLNTVDFSENKLLNNNTVTCIDHIEKNKLILGTSDGRLLSLEKNRITNWFSGFKTSGYIRDLSYIKPLNSIVFVTTESNISGGIINVDNKHLIKAIKKDTGYNFILPKIISNKSFYSTSNNAYKSIKYYNDKIIIAVSNLVEVYKATKLSSPKCYNSDEKILSSIIDKNQNIWMGGPLGLSCLKNGKNNLLTNLKNKNPILKRPISDFCIDTFGRLWVATESYGIYCYDKNIIRTITQLDDLNVRKIKSFGKYLFACTNKGLWRIHLDSLKYHDNIYNFNISNGLASNDVFAVDIIEQNIYIGTNRGLSAINMNHLEEYNSNPKLVVTKIKLGKIELNDTIKTIETEYNNNNLSLDFTCLSYKSQGNIIYEYFMEGLDNEWHISKENQINFFNLSPGSYTFHLRSKSIDGNISNLKEPINIIIRPYWLFSKVSKIVGFCTLIALILYLYFYNLSKLKQKTKNEIEINQQLANLKLEALQSQMNPHFIFNSLNSIQTFIIRNDVEMASEYLTKFGLLIRLILESSFKKFITIEQELQLLKLYCDLEKNRFPDKFEVIFNIDKNIDPQIEIPSLIIQPFIENSINHGVIENNKFGEISIILEKELDYLKIIIDDNGIGRRNSEILKSKKLKSHISRGMQLTNDRINTFNQIHGISLSLEIIDKYDLDEPIGTQVIIKIMDEN